MTRSARIRSYCPRIGQIWSIKKDLTKSDKQGGTYNGTDYGDVTKAEQELGQGETVTWPFGGTANCQPATRR